MAKWLNEPPRWQEDGDRLTFETARETDFWSRTFYGFTHDSGHFRAHDAHGDFTASVSCALSPATLYDQAGLMAYVDEANWLKAGIEFTDGVDHFSVVLTRDGQSDWSMTPLPDRGDQPIAIRLTRHAEALRVQYKVDGHWQMARLGFLDMPTDRLVGPMACSPLGQGLRVTFTDFALGPPISRDLHEDVS